MATNNLAEKIDLEKLPKTPAVETLKPSESREQEPLKVLEKPAVLDVLSENKTGQTAEKISSNFSVAGQQSLSYQKQRALEIDNILAAGLHDVFLKMKPKEQQEFKRVGEETTKKIVAMLDKGQFKINKIIDLIKKWLQLIPGVNKFFLEQEAKIKADKIMRLK